MTAQTDNLYSALLAMYIAEPRFANEVISGANVWPPESKRSYAWALSDLLDHANSLIIDNQELAQLFATEGRDPVYSTQLRAARDAIRQLHTDHVNDVTAPDPFDETPRRQSMSRGWAKVL